MVVEIPRFSQAKFEINRERPLNPIRQDQIEDFNTTTFSLRFLPNVFPWHGHICNYGALPQTWESPYHKDQWTDLIGDKDPVDVCEIGSLPRPSGTVLSVRLLGVLAMIDDGATDWKLIAMNVEEADKLNIKDMASLESAMPGIAQAVQKFFRVYKVPAGDGENKFAYNGEIQDRELAEDVVEFLHEEWREMMKNCSIGSVDGEFGMFSTLSTKQAHWCSEECILNQTQAAAFVNEQPEKTSEAAVVDPESQVWHFLPQSSSSNSDVLSRQSYMIINSLLLLAMQFVNGN